MESYRFPGSGKAKEDKRLFLSERSYLQIKQKVQKSAKVEMGMTIFTGNPRKILS